MRKTDNGSRLCVCVCGGHGARSCHVPPLTPPASTRGSWAAATLGKQEHRASEVPALQGRRYEHRLRAWLCTPREVSPLLRASFTICATGLSIVVPALLRAAGKASEEAGTVLGTMPGEEETFPSVGARITALLPGPHSRDLPLPRDSLPQSSLSPGSRGYIHKGGGGTSHPSPTAGSCVSASLQVIYFGGDTLAEEGGSEAGKEAANREHTQLRVFPGQLPTPLGVRQGHEFPTWLCR